MSKKAIILLVFGVICIGFIAIGTIYLTNYFLEKSKKPSPQLANPASVNCVKQGGTLSIQKNGSAEEYGLCDFGSGYACEEWALYRGDCPKGGVKTTGFDTIEQQYCAWVGGQTLAVPNAMCTFKDGSVCSDKDLYNGTCQKGN